MEFTEEVKQELLRSLESLQLSMDLLAVVVRRVRDNAQQARTGDELNVPYLLKFIESDANSALAMIGDRP